MKLKKILMVALFSLALTANAATITKFKGSKGEYKVYYSGNLKCENFKLNNPERFVVDIIGVNKCSVCDGKLYASKFKNIEIRRCWHKYGFDKIGKIYNKDVLRISFIGPNVEKFVCLKDKKDKIITVRYSAGKTEDKAQSAKLNEIERVSLRKFNTYEMVVVLLKNRPDFQFKKINNAIYLTINGARASKAALLGQDLQRESSNIKSILAIKTNQSSVRYVINLRKKAKVARYYADSRHIYVIFPIKIDKKQIANDNTKNKSVNLKNGLSNEKNKNVLGVNRLISFNVRDAQLKDIFRVFAQISGLNFIIGDDVKGTLTMKLKDVPLDQAMNLILQQEGLVAERRGNVVIIMTAQRYQNEKNQQLKALQDKEKLERMKNSVTKVIDLNYITPDYAVDMINKLLYNSEKSSGFIVSDVKNNAIICHDTPDNVGKIEKIVKLIDQKKKAVEIDARIVEISKTFERQLGIQWGGNFFNQKINHSKTFIGLGGANSPIDVSSGLPPALNFTNENFIVNLPATLTAAPTSTVSLAVGNVMANYNLDLKLSMGEVEGYTKVLSSPKIITLDNQPAKIESGQQIPYQETAGASGATSVSFKDATLSLEVTPHITNDNQVILKLKISKDSPDYSHTVGGEPPINTNSVESTVILKNGQTIVIGGLMQQTTEKTVTGVPGLMRIPILGWLFKTKRIYNPQNELYIFVTPHVLNED